MCNAAALLTRPMAQQPCLLALPVAFLLALALVDLALALGEAKLDLGDAAVVEIDRERHQRDAGALGGADQPVDLALLQQQLAGASRRVAEMLGRLVFREIGVVEEELAVLLGG